jgi:hypothetical protein
MKGIPAIYVAHNLLRPPGPVHSLEVLCYPVDEMVFESTFDELMEEVE